MFSAKRPTLPIARRGGLMEHPQPGQKAAVSGIRAPQYGHENGMDSISSIVAHVIRRAGRPTNEVEPILWIDAGLSEA